MFYFNREPRLKWNKIILAAKIILFHFIDVVPWWNKIISDLSRRRRSTVLKLFYFTRGSIRKWNKIILAWIFMRQCCSQSLHSFTVIATQQPAVAGRQTSEISARLHAGACATNSAHGRGFAKIILWWNHVWNKIILGRSTDGNRSGLK